MPFANCRAIHRASIGVVLLLPWLFTLGCSSQATPQATHTGGALDPGGIATRLRTIAASGTLADLRWPNFPDYREPVQQLYGAGNYAPLWLRDGRPTLQALAVISALEGGQQKGLNPEDYDASRWPSRLDELKTSSQSTDTVANFDAALTVSAMRYISDLHIGRVNPKHFQFGIDIEQKKYDLPQFLLQKIVNASNVSQALNEVEPQYFGYQRTEAALQTYLKMAAEDHSIPLPDTPKTTVPGDAYAGVAPLAKRLSVRGDLPQGAAVDTASGIYDGALVDAVKRFQVRHGIEPDGKLGKETLRQLNTPLSVRVTQLEDALERWRWLPENFAELPVAVNIPEFVLRVFTPDHKIALRMNVVVGKAFGHQTPVFASDMKYIVFRPYWSVPPSIARNEMVPHLLRDPHYLSKQNLEITDPSGRILTSGAVSPEILTQLRSGKVTVRQRPGPKNSLGLVKFIFPNQNNVYLHSTPATQLFAQARRDFSHGCIRVEQPAKLAAFLLQGQPKWTLDNIKAAMESGPDNQQVNLPIPVPVVIVYMTAVVEENGEVYFFDDIYGHDKSLNAVLAKRMPYLQ